MAGAIQPETTRLRELLLRFHSGLVIQLQVSWERDGGTGMAVGGDMGARVALPVSAPSFPRAATSELHAGYAPRAADGEMRPSRNDCCAQRESELISRADPPPVYPIGAIHEPGWFRGITGHTAGQPDFDTAWAIECRTGGRATLGLKNVVGFGWIYQRSVTIAAVVTGGLRECAVRSTPCKHTPIGE